MIRRVSECVVISVLKAYGNYPKPFRKDEPRLQQNRNHALQDARGVPARYGSFLGCNLAYPTPRSETSKLIAPTVVDEHYTFIAL